MNKEIDEKEKWRHSPERQAGHFACGKLHSCILANRIKEAEILKKAIKILSPEDSVIMYDSIFDAYWKKEKYREAIKAYKKEGKLFWRSEKVARYYEKQGLMKKAMREYEYLINEYFKMGKNFLPLPKGPVELYKLGKWYAKKNPKKAEKYLKIYLSAEKKWKGDPACFIRHKTRAEQILKEIKTI